MQRWELFIIIMCVTMKIKGPVVQNMLETPTSQATQQEASLKTKPYTHPSVPLQILILTATTLF